MYSSWGTSLNLADRYLANGTEFTVTASFSEAAAASAGYVVKDPAELTKSYTVSANPGYLTRLSELDPALLKTLQTQATDLINSWMAAKEADSYEIGSFKKNYSHGQVTAHRSYLLVLKDNYRADNIGLSSTPHNRLVLTYAIPQTLVERTATAAEKTTVTTLYLAAVFPNLALNGAGSGLAKAVTPTLLTGAAPHTDPAKLHRDLAEVNQDKYETEMLENAAAL